MRRITDGFLTALGLISRIPVGRRARVDFSLVGVFIPLVGLLVSAVGIGVCRLASWALADPMLVAVVLLTVQYLLFNLFHFDGFVDTMDAVFVAGGSEKRRKVLKDVHAGSFGLFFAVIYVAAKLHLLAALLASWSVRDPGTWVLLSYPVSGRIAVVLLAGCLAPAKPDGLAAVMGRPSPLTVGAGVVLALAPFAVIVVAAPAAPRLLWAFCGAAGGFLSAALIYRFRFGGVTGDGLGFSVEAAELLHLAVFAVLTA